MNYKNIAFCLSLLCSWHISSAQPVDYASTETQRNEQAAPKELPVEPAHSQIEMEDDEDDYFFENLTSNNPIVERPAWQQKIQHLGAAVLIKLLETQAYVESKYGTLKKWLTKKRKKALKKK